MSNGMYDVYSCGFDGVIVRPKPVHKQIILIFAKDFACQVPGDTESELPGVGFGTPGEGYREG